MKVWLSPIKNSWIPLCREKSDDTLSKKLSDISWQIPLIHWVPWLMSAAGSAKGFKGLFDCMSAIIVELLSKLETQVNKVTPPYVFSCVFLISPLISFYSQVLF